jgi:hypothetical protein
MSVDVNIAKRAAELRFDRLEAATYVGAFCTRPDVERVMGGHLKRTFVVTA